jgi:hypothetical protein
MLIYAVMIERTECHGDGCGGPPCAFYSRVCAEAGHLHDYRTFPAYWAQREGVATAHMARVLKEQENLRKQCERRGTSHESNFRRVMIQTVDTSTFQDLFSSAEDAAFRLGGMPAVRKLRKCK